MSKKWLRAAEATLAAGLGVLASTSLTGSRGVVRQRGLQLDRGVEPRLPGARNARPRGGAARGGLQTQPVPCLDTAALTTPAPREKPHPHQEGAPRPRLWRWS